MLPARIQCALRIYHQEKSIWRKISDHPAIKALNHLPEQDQGNLFKIQQCFQGVFSRESDNSKSAALWKVYESVLQEFTANTPAEALPLTDVHEALEWFSSTKALFTENNFNLMRASPNLKGLSEALRDLAGEQAQRNLNPLIVGQDAFDTLVTIAHPDKLYYAWQRLNIWGILDEDYKELIENHPNPLSLTGVLDLFRYKHALNLTPESKARLAQMIDPSCIPWINGLRLAEIFTVLNVNRLLAVADGYLSNPAARYIWDSIPRHLLTQEVLDQLITLAQQANREQLLREYVNRLLNPPEAMPIQRAVRAAQVDTHTASVHKTVSESAKRLNEHFGELIDTDEKLNAVIADMAIWVEHLAEGLIVKESFLNITHPLYSHQDELSGVTTKRLIALIWLAIHDDKTRISSLNEAKKHFADAFYQVQREYNFSRDGLRDTGGESAPSCLAGTFNKFVEKMIGILPDCNIRFLTKEVASYKLSALTRKAAVDYLKLQETRDPENFLKLIDQIKEEGISAIWDNIKESITRPFRQEFAELYKNEEALIEMISTGIWIELNHQEVMASSSRYHRYCSCLLRNSIWQLSAPSEDFTENKQLVLYT